VEVQDRRAREVRGKIEIFLVMRGTTHSDWSRRINAKPERSSAPVLDITIYY